MTDFCQVLVSATSKKEADKIAENLLSERLVAGTFLRRGDSKYHWKGEIVEEEYWNLQAFSLMKHKERIVEEVKKIHSDECPIISFFEMDGNEEFLEWVKKSVE